MGEFAVPTLIGYFERVDERVFWGFNLSEGVFDLHPITFVSNVSPHSIAENAGLKVGDQLLKVGNIYLTNITLQDVQTVFKQIGNQFHLVVYRPPRSDISSFLPVSHHSNQNNGTDSSPGKKEQSQTIFDPQQINISISNPGESVDSGLSSCHTSNSDFDNNQHRDSLTGKHLMKRDSKCRDHMSSEMNDFWQSKWSTAGIMSARLCTSMESQLYDVLPSSALDSRCWKCRAPVRPPYVQALSRFYCKDHFRCQHCAYPLYQKEFVEENGQIYCLKDYSRDLAPRCNKCRYPIVGQVVTALNLKWHPNCLTCVTCSQVLSDEEAFIVGLDDQQPYCNQHWNEKYVKRCQGCGGELNPQYDDYIEDGDCSYHSWCFSCAKCGAKLAEKCFLNDSCGRPICESHE